MGQEPQIYANIITTTFYFIQKLNKILFWLVGYTCLCSIIISYVFVAWCCWYGIRFFKFHMYANGYYLLLLLCMIDWYEIFFVFIDIIVAEDTSTLLSSNVVRSVCIGTCLYYCSKCSNDSFPAINFEKQKILCAMMSTWEYSIVQLNLYIYSAISIFRLVYFLSFICQYIIILYFRLWLWILFSSFIVYYLINDATKKCKPSHLCTFTFWTISNFWNCKKPSNKYWV